VAEIDDLIDEHGEETVRKAFWLQEKIYEEGIEAVRFSDAAERAMEQKKRSAVRRNVSQRTQKDF